MPLNEGHEAFLVINKLQTSYASRYGVPVIHSVDSNIFVWTYYTFCKDCSFCHDECCAHGVDVDVTNVNRIKAHARELEIYTGVERARWFTNDYTVDEEFPGLRYARTQIVDGACVFHNPQAKGCMLHSFCLKHGMDYHELKPMVSCLFPITFDNGLLHPADEVEAEQLICLGHGPTLYRGIRDEILYYFGDGMVRDLDEMEKEFVHDPSVTQIHELFTHRR